MTLRRGLAALLVCGACTAPKVGPPPASPSLDRPGAAIPADLDVALRFDVVAAKRFFGPTVANALAIDVVDAKADAATARFFEDALDRADVVWIALRPGSAPALTDNVVMLRGRFGDLDPPRDGPLGFGPMIDLGGGFRVYERKRPERRSAPSRLYARADDWLVFVSEAEVDAVERSLERRAGDDHVDPPDRGIVSFAARSAALVPFLERDFPLVAEALQGAGHVEATAEADDRGLRATLSVTFGASAEAEAARDHVAPLLTELRKRKGVLGAVARGMELGTDGATLVVRENLDATALSSVVNGSGEPLRTLPEPAADFPTKITVPAGSE